MVAGRLVMLRSASVLVATSNVRWLAATSRPVVSIHTRPERISYRAPVAGVNVKALSTVIVGVVPAVLPTMNRSSTLPAVVSMMRILKPYSPEPPRLASMFRPTPGDGKAVESVNEVVVAPAAIVPTAANDGTNALVEPPPSAGLKPGLAAKDHDFVTMLKRFRMAAVTKLYAKGLRDRSERMSAHIELPRTWAFGDGATCTHISRSSTFLKLFAIS